MRMFALCILMAVAINAFVIPVHIPMNNGTEIGTSYDVPAWLGVFEVDTADASVWQLAPTYEHGGATYPGQFLMIRNHGPECVTLVTTAPETIEGAASYPVAADTAVIIMSNDDDWVVVSLGTIAPSDCVVPPPPSSSSSSAANSGTFPRSLRRPAKNHGGKGYAPVRPLRRV